MVCNGRNSRRYLSRAHHLLLKWHSHVRRVGLQVKHLQPVAPVWHAYGRCMQLGGKTNSSCNPVQMAVSTCGWIPWQGQLPWREHAAKVS